MKQLDTETISFHIEQEMSDLDPLTCMSSKCYFSSNIKVKYDVAVSECKSHGGKLFEPKSMSENKKVSNYVKSKLDGFWIGVNDRDANKR